MVLAPLFPYIAAGCVLAGLGGGWWIMDARLDRCKTARVELEGKVANRDATIEALRTANGDLHRAVSDQSAASLRLADEGRARQQRAEAALEAIRRAQTAQTAATARLDARIQDPGASALDCAVATAEVRASIR